MFDLLLGITQAPQILRVTVLACYQFAIYLWKVVNNKIIKAQPYLSNIIFPQKPNQSIIKTLRHLIPYKHNIGVFFSDGSQKLSSFFHHMDNNLYADIDLYSLPALTSSIVSIHTILGFLDDKQLKAFLPKKLETQSTHLRTCTGNIVDSKRLIISLPNYKKKFVVNNPDNSVGDIQIAWLFPNFRRWI